MRILAVVMVVAMPFAFSKPACATDARDSERAAQFEREIRPILAGQCVQCHGPKKQEGGLRLDSRDGLMAGGDSGPILVAGKPEESLIINALHHRDLAMPPDKKLSDKTILHFERWIEAGAVWPATVAMIRPAEGNITDGDRQWWAFQPLKKVDPHRDAADTWSRNAIDQFVWNALTSKQMRPAPTADKSVLLRRVYFDLIGLPPSPKEIDDFLADSSSQAFESVVDRLLSDPRYGEHWARFWLDLVRYSESDGWNQDAYRPHIYRYRDYVVSAFNRDLSYPQFVRDQLAGDEVEDNPEGLTAAGYLRLGIYEYNQRDARGQWNDIMNEQTDVAGDVFLGLSVACARCHQHKFDPISQRDYFKLRAFFEPVVWRDDLVAATEQEKKVYQEQLAVWRQASKDVNDRIDALVEPYATKKWKSTVDKFPLDIQACFYMNRSDRTSWQEQMNYLVSRQYMDEGGGPLKGMKKEDLEKHDALQKELAQFDHLKPKPLPAIMTATDFNGLISPTVNPDDPARQPIAPGFLDVLAHHEQLPTSTADNEIRSGTSGRRTALAKWIGSPQNPLTNRVIVNRIWQQHFGQGLVSTSNDFGHLGDTPSHPELLDWLTLHFIENGWSFKKLHRLILLSATWQQSALHPDANSHQSSDPGERLLWRARVRRLQAEQIRDAMLLASGELTSDIGGPSVEEDKPRRSLYLKSFRNQGDTFLHGFDVANGLQSVALRDTTTTPNQSLLLFNGAFTLARARQFAQRVIDEHDDPVHAIRSAFRWTWGSEPTVSELESAERFLQLGVGEDRPALDPNALADFIHILLNSNRFLYLE